MSFTSHSDTIYALSSGALPSGVAVVRISGKKALATAELLCGSVPASRQAALRTIRTRNDIIIDRALVLPFHGPASFTGEDCVEIHLHGGRAVVQALLSELASFDGLRLAEQGEFSRRALEHGKLDLVQIEGLADLIAAETEMQRRLAVEQASGGLSTLYHSWADRLTRGRALIEAELDFSDEDDVPGSVSEQVWSDLRGLRVELDQHLQGASAGEIIRDGLKIVIAGPPNAGKSSLMNALARREVAIVTDIAGTTRDILQVELDIEGFVVKLYDTAGLRASAETVEREGIRRAREAIASADLILALEEIGTSPVLDEAQLARQGAKAFRIGTKLDLHVEGDQDAYDIAISTETGAGLAGLHALIAEELRSRISGMSSALPNRLRHVQNLTDARAAIEMALSDENAGLDVRAEHLRLAGDSLGRITGRVDVEGLLDVIFSEFCIGK
ncbi:tRNA uridine-5-carboxymethylaminomethyl(34) synthesis GTPase MnmE [Rhizobium sp. BK251]|uniref:tRNA uridine-5-carboxymethylaminomethyl(34) synthesis GTPase MnmE n=1 Tax=Rhizobium sp. BK251 TaxID=2512125 RepID=UPI00104A6543|nr:tRNA uridine-5-carboxymethylaminomethyl(34) synthesis GTPase MnmE [Rhizobium sp. BK251]TCL73077.1 tRNA modification GTPase trmE [Rhizobium sp. BK251]